MAIKNIKNIGQVDVENGDRIYVDLDDINGRIRVQVRQWYQKDGEYFPGRNGVTFSVEEWDAVRKLAPAKGDIPAASTTTAGNGRSGGRK